MDRARSITAAFMAVFLLPVTASAQSFCLERTALLARLAERAQERPVAIALTSAGAVIEVLASRDGATWTLIATAPTGISCVALTGEHWQSLAPPEAGERS